MNEEEWLRQLAEKDRLIQQLAQELIQVNQFNRTLQQQPEPRNGSGERNERVQWLEQQNSKLREDMALKEKENYALLDKLQQVQQENQKLQQYLRDVPELYRRKFSERIAPIKARLQEMESENKRLVQALPSGVDKTLLLPSSEDLTTEEH